MSARVPAAAILALLVAAWPGCAPPAPGGASVPAEEPPLAVEIAAEAESTPEAEPTPATLDEIRAICRVYRQATYGRWDDQRTRGELGGLELTSDTATLWQTHLTATEPTVALDATRAVLVAAHEAGVASACQPLEGLVAVATGFADAPTGEAAPAEADAGSP